MPHNIHHHRIWNRILEISRRWNPKGDNSSVIFAVIEAYAAGLEDGRKIERELKTNE